MGVCGADTSFLIIILCCMGWVISQLLERIFDFISWLLHCWIWKVDSLLLVDTSGLLFQQLDPREADDPCPFLLAIWGPGTITHVGGGFQKHWDVLISHVLLKPVQLTFLSLLCAIAGEVPECIPNINDSTINDDNTYASSNSDSGEESIKATLLVRMYFWYVCTSQREGSE